MLGNNLASYYELEIGVPGSFPTSAVNVTVNKAAGPITPADFPALIAHAR